MNEFGIVTPAPPAVVIDGTAECTSGELTAVVTGLPFSGTSMVAVVVDALGVPIIRDAAFPFAYEADEFNNVDLTGLRQAVERHNAERKIWGWKDPHAHRFHPWELDSCLRNPHYIFVTKDLASVVARSIQNPVVYDGKPAIRTLTVQVALTEKFMRWMLSFPVSPRLLVSYYAGVRQPLELCQIIARFLHLTPTPEQFERAVARISPVGGYLVKEDT